MKKKCHCKILLGTVNWLFTMLVGSINSLNPNSDYYLISPHNINPESHIKVMRIEEMVTRKEAL